MNNLDSLIKRIERMPNSQEKMQLIAECHIYLNFLKKMGKIKESEYSSLMIEGIDIYNQKAMAERYNEMVKFSESLDDINDYTHILIQTFKDEQFVQMRYSPNDRINLSECIDSVMPLFKSLDPNLYKIMDDLLCNKNIYVTHNLSHAGEAFGLTHITNPKIILKTIGNYFYSLTCLFHELGHCYEFTCCPNAKLTKFNLFLEVSSYFIERMVIDFFSEKENTKEATQMCEISETSDVYMFSQLCNTMSIMMDDNCASFDLNGDFYYDQKYFNDYIDKENYKAFKFFGLDIYSYVYMLSYIIVDNLMNVYRKDKVAGYKLFREFITTQHLYTPSELLKKYANKEVTIDNIKKVAVMQKKIYHL